MGVGIGGEREESLRGRIRQEIDWGILHTAGAILREREGI